MARTPDLAIRLRRSGLPTTFVVVILDDPAHVPSAVADTSEFGALRVDHGGRQAFLGSRELGLRVKLFDLLSALARQPRVAVSRESLMQQVWTDNWYSSTKTLDVHVAELRRVLTDAASVSGVLAPRIVTQRGFGFRLEPAHD